MRAIIGGVIGGTILYGCPYLIPPALGIGCLLAVKHNRKHHKGPRTTYLKPRKHTKVYWLRDMALIPVVGGAISLVGGIPFVILGAELGFALMFGGLAFIFLAIGGAFDGKA